MASNELWRFLESEWNDLETQRISSAEEPSDGYDSEEHSYGSCPEEPDFHDVVPPRVVLQRRPLPEH